MLPSSPAMVKQAFGYMLEHPRIPRYEATRNNATGADDQQERPGAILVSSETARRTSGFNKLDDDTVRALRRRREAGRNDRPPITTGSRNGTGRASGSE